MIFKKGYWNNQAATPNEGVTMSVPQPSVQGIDISHYQAGIDFRAIVAAGNKFVYAKATDGLNSDPTFQGFRQAAKAAGLLFGGYHFFRFDIDPILQAQKAFASTAGVAVGELPFFLDVEWDKQSKSYGEGSSMDTAAAKSVWACLTEMERLIGSVGIYTNYYFWSAGYPQLGFSKYPLWVPAYNTTIEKVQIPEPWHSLSKPSFWQYSESITLGGTTNVDGNYFLGTQDQLNALVKK